MQAVCAASYVGQTDQERVVRWYLQAWSQGAGTSGFFFYFTVADVLRELGVTPIEMLILALLSGLK